MEKRDIKFLKLVHLRGPNMWTYRPVIEAWIDIGDLEDSPSNTIPGFYERLSAWLPSLIEHRCSYEERGGFLRRVQEGTWPGHILEHVTLELQNLAGMPGGFGKAREMNKRGHYKVVVRAWHEEVTTAALHAARELILAAMNDEPYDVAANIERLTDLVDSLCLGPSTASIVDGADDRDIPSIRLSEGNLVQLGYGAAQRRIWTAETDRTSAIAETISRDKDLTKTLLQSCGVAVPEGRLVDSPADAWDAAEDIGVPVVVKPYDGNHGRGVFTNLTTREQVETAYGIALEEGSGVIVEKFIEGCEHRLLVVGDRLVAANKGDEAKVVGDGQQTIYELIQSQINADPRRGETEEHPLNRIRINSSSLLEIQRQGYADENAVPPAGVEVMIQRTGNHAFDVTDEVHPQTAATAALAARIVGLDIAGIDLVVKDISKPLADQGGAIVEVNAGPSLLMHLKPAVGKPRPVGKAIANHLFPKGDSGRIPVVGICGTTGSALIARLIGRLLQLGGKYIGVACADGLYLDHRRSETGDRAHWEPARRLLMNRAVEAAVIENSVEVILNEGLAYDRCQVGVVTRIDPAAHQEAMYIDSPEMVAKVVRTQVDVVLKEGAAVLDADDAQVRDFASLCDGEVIFFARERSNPAVTAHLAEGKRAVFLLDSRLVLAKGRDETLLLDMAATPLAGRQKDPEAATTVLAAVGAAWALGLAPEIIRAGVETFELDPAAI